MHALFALLLTCTNVPTPDITRIEVYGNGDAEQVVLHLKSGEKTSYEIEPTGLGVEESLPLPKWGTSARVLENRHTGWHVTTYTGGVIHRESVECD